MPAGESEITLKTVIDISHESLMRAWRNLRNWVDEEAQSAKIYRRLADTATLYKEDKAGLYRDPDLQISISWREENRPTKTWADRYYPGFDIAMAFLDESQEEADRESREREEARQREVAQAKALAEAEQEKAEAMERLAITQKRRAVFASILSVIAIVATGFAVFAWKQAKESEEKAILALVSGQELLKEDVDKALGIMKRKQDGFNKFTLAMREKSRSYFNGKDFKSSLVAIQAANEIDTTNTFTRLFEGRINLELNEYNQAISNVIDFANLELERPLDESIVTTRWMLGASIIAQASNLNAYTNYCHKMFEKFSSAKEDSTFERIAKGALMLETNTRLMSQARNYALKAVEKSATKDSWYNWYAFTLAWAEYRLGKLEEAEKWSNISKDYTPETHPFLPGMNSALMSSIYFKTSRRTESYKALTTARECLDKLGDRPMDHDATIISLLIKEREILEK